MGKEIDFACEKDKKETITDPGRSSVISAVKLLHKTFC